MIRWITDRIGTSPWADEFVSGDIRIVDVRDLRDGSGNAPSLIKEKVDMALCHLKHGERVVICCDYGISRSNAVAAAVLAKLDNRKLNETLLQVIDATGEERIKIDFVNNLRLALNESQGNGTGNRILVIGADSFVGRAICQTFDSESTVCRPGEERSRIFSPVILDAAVQDEEIGWLLFCWHPVGIDTNEALGELLTGLRNALEVCRIRRVRLVFISGHQVFAGLHPKEPEIFGEERAPLPSGAAGDGFFLAETLINLYQTRHGLPVLIIRPSFLYGAEDDRRNFFNTFVRKAILGEEIVTHHFKDGPARVDLLHIKDFANAVRMAVNQRIEGVLHVASGALITTRELAERLVACIGSESTVRQIEMPGLNNLAQLDARRARTGLGWEPYISLEEGILDVYSCKITP